MVNFYSLKCCPQSILAVAPRDRPKRLPERHFW